MSASSFELNRRSVLGGLGLAGMTAVAPRFASAQGRAETLLVVQELGPNSLDMQGVGSNQTVNGLSWNCYDRLLTYASKTLPDGTLSYDREKLAPELAESWEVAADGMSCTFKLRKDAKFHDGTPVTAKDVKWSFDRAVKVGGFPTFQMSAGSLEKPEQFVVVDDHTFRIDYVRKDKMLLFNVAVVVPFIINSELAKKNATAEDPWALAWLRTNEAGGGAYRIESWKPGSETVLARFDDWKSGPLPKLKRIIARDVPSAGTRRAMLERGDADISSGFAPRDFEQIIKEGKVKVSGVPIPNALWYVALNTAKPPFDNVKLRQAVAWAMPYEQIQSSAFFGRAVPMYGGAADVSKPVWPQPFPYVTDLDKAKALMKEAGFESGLRDDAVARHRHRDRRRADRDPDPGKSRQDRHQGGDREDSRRELAHDAEQEGAAARAQPLQRLARLPRILLLLEFPRQQFDLQHLLLPEQGDGRADRQGALHHGCCRVRQGREGFHRALHARRSGRSRSTSRSTTSPCRRPSPATSSGFIASRTTGSSRRASFGGRR